MATPKFHLITEAFTWTAGDVCIYLTPSDAGWDVTAIDMMGDVIEAESFALESTARRFIDELVKDLSS